MPASISAPKRGTPASTRRISAASGLTSTAPASISAASSALALGGGGRGGRCRRGCRPRRTSTPADAASLRWRTPAAAAVPAISAARGPISERSARSAVASATCDVAPDRVHRQVRAARRPWRRARGRAGSPPRRPAAPAGRSACGPCGRAAPRTGPRRPPSASTSFVSCPCRYSAPSGPGTAITPRSARSSSPHSSRSWRYWASSSTVTVMRVDSRKPEVLRPPAVLGSLPPPSI